ncbi:MAG: hypothetical protein Q4A62_10520 [Eikenella sp.]|nr:hypothetical protein [Eikenella sp.]
MVKTLICGLIPQGDAENARKMSDLAAPAGFTGAACQTALCGVSPAAADFALKKPLRKHDDDTP